VQLGAGVAVLASLIMVKAPGGGSDDPHAWVEANRPDERLVAATVSPAGLPACSCSTSDSYCIIAWRRVERSMPTHERGMRHLRLVRLQRWMTRRLTLGATVGRRSHQTICNSAAVSTASPTLPHSRSGAALQVDW
jgi:hypothetical protein